jgi:uncharacterized protein
MSALSQEIMSSLTYRFENFEFRQIMPTIDLPTEQITEFCDRWQITEFALFGSVLRDDFRPDSDIDIMVQFHPDAHPTFSSLDQMEAELKAIFQRDIDLITRQGIETSRNYLRRQEILSSAQVIYATRPAIPT